MLLDTQEKRDKYNERLAELTQKMNVVARRRLTAIRPEYWKYDLGIIVETAFRWGYDHAKFEGKSEDEIMDLMGYKR